MSEFISHPPTAAAVDPLEWNEAHTWPLPAIAITAFALLSAQFRRDIEQLQTQTLEALPIAPADRGHWSIDFQAGTAIRRQELENQ